MSKDIGKIRQLIVLALVLFMIASILGIFILFQPEDDRFQFYIHAADISLQNGSYRDLPDLLLKASRYADTRDQWFSLFKRSYLSARETGDFLSFYELISRSRKFLKAGIEHDALYTASLLWTDQYEKASASLYAINQPGYETLTAETLLSFEVFRNYNIGEKDPITYIKEKIAYQEDPVFFQVIGELSDNEILLYNSAVLFMEAGETEKASVILDSLSTKRIPPYSLGIVYYDLAQYPEALKHYQAQDVVDQIKENQRYSMKEQIGDIYFLLHDREEALLAYEEALQRHESGSWKLYRNIGRLYFRDGYSRKAKLLLEKGLNVFPDQIELLSDYVSYFSRDYSLIVEKRLNDYISRFPGDMQARLLKIRYFPDSLNPTQYQARLWEYFNESENNEKVTRFLLWYLSGLKDADSIEIVLKRYNYGEEKPHWYYFYEGILASLRNDPVGALKKMEEASSIYPSWIYESNKSALNLILENRDASLIQINKAISLLEEEKNLENSDLLLSNLYVRLGDMYLDLKDFQKAVESFTQAVTLDPDNFKAETKLNRIQ